MPPEFDGILNMVNAHEDRIQRLEVVTSELASSVAEQNATMRAFSLQMRMMSDSVCEKLEDVSSRLSDKIGSIGDISKGIVQEQKAADHRLTTLERGEKTDEKVTEFWLKVAYFLVTAIGGAGSTLLVQFLSK